MKRYFTLTNIVFALALIAFVIGVSAFSQKQKSGRYSFRKEQFSDNDTSASGKRDRNGANRSFIQLDEQMKQLEIEMKNLDSQMKNLDLTKYQMQADELMQKVDFEKINEQIENALESINLKEVNDRVAESLTSLSKVKMAEVIKELEQVKVNLKNQKADIKFNAGKINADIEDAMKNATKSIADAREEIKNVRDFTRALEKDGLIDRLKAFKIEVKNGELYIDGKKQPNEISDKYRQYYRKTDFTIDTNEEEGIRI